MVVALRVLPYVALAGCVFAFTGCTHAPAARTETTSTPPATAAEQIALGGQLFGEHCASCHGATGSGGKAPPVVGQDALPKAPRPDAKLRDVEFRTALDVGKWVMQNMPPKKAGSLTPDEYLAVLAFDLKANGVDLQEPLTIERAEQIVLHP